MSNATTSEPTFELDASGRLIEPLACRECGYDLRGLLPTDACPECGLAVSASMRSDLLGHMRPAWLKTVRSGIMLMFVSLALGIVGGVVVGVVTTVLAAGAAMTGGGAISWISLAAIVGQAVVLGAVWLAGVYRFTAAEPGGLRPGYHRVVRAARTGEVIRFAISIATAAVTGAMMAGLAMGVGGGLFVAQAFLGVLGGVAGVVSFAAMCLYAARLFDRVPTAGLTRQARRVAWGYVIAGAIATAGQLTQVVYLQFVLNPTVNAGGSGGGQLQAAQASAGQAVAGGQTQTNQYPNNDGTRVTITTTTYPDGSIWTQTETTDASGRVVSTSSSVQGQQTFMGPGVTMPWLFFVVQGVLVIGGLGLMVFMIWALVLAILLYRRLNAAIVTTMARGVIEAPGGYGVPASG